LLERTIIAPNASPNAPLTMMSSPNSVARVKFEAILAKRGAVKLITKRDFFLETDRDPSRKATALYSLIC
jgi:hypothetical protein